MSSKKPLIFILYLFLISTFSLAQTNNNDINNTLSNLSTDAAKPYIEPIISAFGSNLNSAWVSSLPQPKKFAFSLDLKIVGMGSFFKDNEKTFSTSGNFRFTDSQAQQLVDNISTSISSADKLNIKNQLLSKDFNVTIGGPTIIGSSNERVKITFAGQTFTASGNTFTVPQTTITLTDVKGFLDNLQVLPTASIQLGLGTIYGTNLMVRWLPDVDIKDLGKFSFWGVGGLHNIGVWFDEAPPIDIAVGGFYERLIVGSIFETNSTQFGIYLSKTFGSIIAFSPYLGLTTETSTTKINYDYEFDTATGKQKSNIAFELKGVNTIGLTLGASFKLAILNFNVDYKIAKINTLSAGLNFGF